MDNVVRPHPASRATASVPGGGATRLVPASLSEAVATAEITPRLAAVIYEAVTAFFGRKVRILSVKVGSESLLASKGSWTGQGRDVIHASHNLVQRGR